MFSHNDIWIAIDRLADSRGFSPSGLARQAGLDPTAFNKSKRVSPTGKPRWPSTESLAKILTVTNCTMADLLVLMDSTPGTISNYVPFVTYAALLKGRIVPPANPEIYPVHTETGPDAFAVQLGDSAFHPLFREGAVIVAEPISKPSAGDRILLFSREDGLKGGIVESVQKRVWSVMLPDDNFSTGKFQDDSVDWVARILWSTQ